MLHLRAADSAEDASAWTARLTSFFHWNGTGCPERLWTLHSWRWSNLSGHGPGEPALGGPVAGDWIRWHSEVPSNFNQSVSWQIWIGNYFISCKNSKAILFYVGMNSNSLSFVPEMHVTEKLSLPSIGPQVFSWHLQCQMSCPCCARYRTRKFSLAWELISPAGIVHFCRN